MIRFALMTIVLLALARYAASERYALLVGNSSAKGNFAPLKYVPNDLRSLKDLLSDCCGFKKDRIVTIYNGTRGDLDGALASLSGRMRNGNRDMFLFYYSGHADRSGLKIGDETYPLDTLKQKFTDVPSDIRIGIFDACQSGSFARIKGGRLDEPFLLKDDGKIKGQVILCSSSMNENAQESDALGNSVFTFYFLNALRGSADISGDGRVTLSEAYQYSYSHTLSNTAGTEGGAQHPWYQFRIQGEGDIVLADLNLSSRGIVIGAEVRGNITILREGTVVVADFMKELNGAIMIAVNPGAYRILNSRDGKRYQATLSVEGNSVRNVRQSDFRPVGPERPGRAKGAEDCLFSFGITISGGCDRYDLSDLDASMCERFSAYRHFSITPRFSMPRYACPVGVAAECVVAERFGMHLGFRGYRTFRAESDYHGTHTGPANGASYGVKLHVRHTLSMYAADIGFRCYVLKSNSYSKHAFLGAGIDIFSIGMNVSTRFSDSLYNVTTEAEGAERGALAFPYAAIGYEWPLGPWMTVGARARYRYQKAALEVFDSDSDSWNTTPETPLRCNAGGVDGALFLNVHLRLEGLSW